MTGSVEQGISQTHGNTHILHFLVRLPQAVATVWPALATAEGLASWFTSADVLEPRLGGAVTLRDTGAGGSPRGTWSGSPSTRWRAAAGSGSIWSGTPARGASCASPTSSRAGRSRSRGGGRASSG